MQAAEVGMIRNVRVLTGFFERMRGLLGRDSLPVGEVYAFPRCNAVHTLGMRFPIDIVFLDRDGRVLSVHAGVPPGRWMVSGGRRAKTTLEAAAGWLAPALSPGMSLPAIESARTGRSGKSLRR